jgi:hypothetical protein
MSDPQDGGSMSSKTALNFYQDYVVPPFQKTVTLQVNNISMSGK